MLSLKASQEGLEKIKYARINKGKAIEDKWWQREASKILEPDRNWDDLDFFASGITLATFRRFLYGMTPILAPSFQAYCKVLGLDWEEIVEQEGQNPAQSAFYIQRKSSDFQVDEFQHVDEFQYIESQCYAAINKPGEILRIKAPEKMGKTWLLEKILNFAREQGYQTVKLNFRLADSTVFNDYQTFLQWFCLNVGESLDIKENLDEYWTKRSGLNRNCTRYFQNYLLANIYKPLVLGLDDVDLVFEQPAIFNDFCKLIRSWHEQALSTDYIGEIWKKIRFVIVHSTEVYRGMDIYSSPLGGVGQIVEPPEFNNAQVALLAQKHGLDWNKSDIEKLMVVVGGNPALVRKALDCAKQQNIFLVELLRLAPTESGVFRDYLGRLLHKLRQYPELAEAFLLCVNSQEPVDIDSQLAFKLHRMGLVKLQENFVFPSCNLYRQFFRERLGVSKLAS